MTFMRRAPRSSRAMGTGSGRRLVRAVATAFVLAAAGLSSAQAQPLPAPAPTPTPGLTIISSEISAGAAASNLGSSFLERLGNEATNGVNRSGRTNPGGGGASEAAEAPKFRAWGEAYGISARTGLQGDFAGDRRTTWGGVAGIGATVAPGVNVEPQQDRRAAGVPIGDSRSYPARRQLLHRQRAGDGRRRHLPRLRPDQLIARYRSWLCDRRLRGRDRRCTDRARLLLDAGPKPHRAEDGLRICAFGDGVLDRDPHELLPGRGARRDGGARPVPGRRRDRALLDIRSEDSRLVGLWQVHQQRPAEFWRGDGQHPRLPLHQRAVRRREQVWRGRRRRCFTQSFQLIPPLRPLRRQVSRGLSVAPGDRRPRAEMVARLA